MDDANWTCPPSQPIVGLISRIQELAKKAEDVLANMRSASGQALYEILHKRLEEHATSVRAKVAGEIEMIPHLCQSGGRSAEILKEAKATASIRFLSMTAMMDAKKGLKETVVGARLKEPWARNSEGEMKKYERAEKPTDDPWAKQMKPRPRNAETKEAQCYRFGEFGHWAKDTKTGKNCTKPFWEINPEWSSWQKNFAQRLRKELKEKQKEKRKAKEAKKQGRKPRKIKIDNYS